MTPTITYKPSRLEGILQPFWAIAYYFFLILFGVFSLFLNIVFGILSLLFSKKRLTPLFQATLRGLTQLYIKLMIFSGITQVSYKGFEKVPQDCQLFASNHPCLFDAFFLFNYYPNVLCIFKATLSNNLMRTMADVTGFVANDSGAGTIKSAVAQLENGHRLLVFPEGTRTTTHPVNVFKPGAALISKQSKRPIQTIFIRTNSNALSKSISKWTVPVLPAVFEIEVGKQLSIEPGESTRAFNERLEHYFYQELNRTHVINES